MPAPRSLCLVILLTASLGGTSGCAGPAPATAGDILDEIHATVAMRFFDPGLKGVDWSAARTRARAGLERATDPAGRADALNAMLAELGASHTQYLTDEDQAWYVLLELFWDAFDPERRERLFPDGRPDWPGIGVLTERVELAGEHAWFARTVLAGGPAEAAGVRVGDRLLAVEGQPFRPVAPFRARVGQPTRVQVQRTSDPASARELVLVPESGSPSALFRRALEEGSGVLRQGGKRLAYAPLVSWAGEELQAALQELLLTGPLSGADGLVLDLRGGFGGANPEYLNLFRRDLPRLAFRNRAGHELVREASWRKPVVLLVDEGTTSGKEIVARAFQREKRGPVVGARTAGAVLGGSAVLLADGSLLYLAVSDVRVDGERLEGVGVTPDVLVPFVRPYAAGADPQLERALATLAAELRPNP
jgi:carboxyl-terminal processing protease